MRGGSAALAGRYGPLSRGIRGAGLGLVRRRDLCGRMLVVGRSCFEVRRRRRVLSEVGGLLLRTRRVCRLF